MKTIDICYVAWPRDEARLDYLRQSLESLKKFVRASRHQLAIYVSLETLDVSTELFTAARELCALFHAKPYWRNMPPSLGGNMNDALMLGYGDYKLLSQDDWAWERNIDLSIDADFLDVVFDYALIRYATFYTEFDDLVTGTVPFGGVYENVKMDGPYPYGDQPHLRRGDFATKKSATGGDPIGFFVKSEFNDYAAPENIMAAHLVKNGWKIAAYSPNVCGHVGSLSSSLARRG